MRIIVFCLLLTLISCGCSSMPVETDPDVTTVYSGFKTSDSPYNATPERVQQIVDGYRKLYPGVSMEQVRQSMGPPDEAIRNFALLAQEEWAKHENKIGVHTGYTYTYIIKDVDSPGSSRNQYVTCKFDLKKMLTLAWATRINGLKDIGKGP